MIIYEKLHKIQQALKVPKDAVNKFGNYNYRTAESILRAFKEKNEELNLGLTLVLDDEIIFIEGRFYIRAIATLSDGTISDFENNKIERVNPWRWKTSPTVKAKKGNVLSQIFSFGLQFFKAVQCR
jgi:hypothetical protein